MARGNQSAVAQALQPIPLQRICEQAVITRVYHSWGRTRRRRRQWRLPRRVGVAMATATVTWLVTPELRPGPGPRDMNALAGRPHSTIATSTGRRACLVASWFN
eukprot:scaffold21965_cov64-Phaeocystis_antarctica.AAC.1